MFALKFLISIKPRLQIRNITYDPTAVVRIDPSPVKLAFALYESKFKDKHEYPPLLIFHGFFGSKSNWRTVCKALQRETNPMRKIIAVDARNHGDSSHSTVHSYNACANDIKALLKSVRISKVAVMGHSMGGRTAMYLALSNPELVERLIVVDISPVSNNQDLNYIPHIMTAMSEISVPPKVVLSTAKAVVEKALKPVVLQKREREFLTTNLIQTPDGNIAWRLNIPALKENFSDISNFPIRPKSGRQYMGPTTFITGEFSDYIPQADHDAIKQLFPKATFSKVPGTAHWVHSENRTVFLNIVLNALNKPV